MVALNMSFKIEYKGIIVGNNQRYAYKSKKINSEKYNSFKKEIYYLCKDQNKNNKILKDKVEILILYNSTLDIDNIFKGIFDAIEGLVYNNDRQIKKLRVDHCRQIEKGFVLYANELP